MKIGIITPSDLPVPSVLGGAIETLIEVFLKQNEKHGINDIIVFSKYNKEAFEVSKNYKHTKFVWIKYNYLIYGFINFFIRAFRKLSKIKINNLDILILEKLVSKESFDTLIIEGNSVHLIALSKYVKPSKILFHIHANIFTEKNKENDAIVKGCWKIIGVSEFIKKQVLHNSVAEESRVVVLRNCIDIELFSKKLDNKNRTQVRKSFGINCKDIVIIFAGRIVIEKGIIELIQALTMLTETISFKLLVVGSFGSGFGASIDYLLKHKLEQTAANIHDKIIFTGFVQNNKIPIFYSISDIAVIPTTIYEEAAGLVAIEAMASGLPLIVSDSGGLPEYVNDECAIIVKRGQKFVETLNATLRELILNENLRHSMGIAGEKQSLKYGQKQYYNNFIKIIS